MNPPITVYVKSVACQESPPGCTRDTAELRTSGFTVPHGSIYPGTYALVAVGEGTTVTTEGYWICEYPEFNDPECQSHYCPPDHGDACSHPEKARMPWKHSQCERVTIVGESVGKEPT